MKILESLEGVVESTAFLFDAFLSSYGESYRKLRRGPPMRHFGGEADAKRAEANFRVLLYRLRHDGLIQESQAGRRSFILTRKGKEWLQKLRARKKRQLPKGEYTPEAVREFTIIAFDIPEREKRKRHWLRAVLKRLECVMIQRSVWSSTRKLPEAFLHDLKQCGVLDCVEIFSISRTGTLRRRLPQ